MRCWRSAGAVEMMAMASASETTSRTRMRPPHFRQRVMSMAKQRARSWAHAMRRGRGEELGEEASGSSGGRSPARAVAVAAVRRAWG